MQFQFTTIKEKDCGRTHGLNEDDLKMALVREMTRAIIIQKLPSGNHEIHLGVLQHPTSRPRTIEAPGFNPKTYVSIANVLLGRGIKGCTIRIEKGASQDFADNLKRALEQKGVYVRD
ncbi:TPA: hypothetical protein HA244_05875 [Candidatus Micrarchaeota archaeon]|nr:hypothetical protein [Candidatus Micrarchaeota archaeon]